MATYQVSPYHLMHRLWTKARGHHGYNKREWKTLERKMSVATSAIFDPLDIILNREPLPALVSRLRAKAEGQPGYMTAEWEALGKETTR